MATPSRGAVSAAFRERMLTIALTTLIPIFTGAAYITGLAYHEAYFHVFRIPATLMTIGAADHFVYAYRTITELGWSIFRYKNFVLSFCGFIFWVAFVWLSMDVLTEKARRSRFAIFIRGRFGVSPPLKVAGRILLIPTAIATAFFYLLVVVLILLVVPAELGGAAGRMAAQDELDAFSKGCQKPVGTRFCNSILESDKPLAYGYIVGSSEKNLVVYDGKKTILVPRGDKTAVTTIGDETSRR